MNEQAIKNVTALRLAGQNLRRDARKKPEVEARTMLADAAANLIRAISILRRELRLVGTGGTSAGDRAKLRALLSQTLGSLGGTYRDAKDYVRAIEKYDEGNEIEEQRRTQDGDLDSYNLVQRLVVRLLKDPHLLGDPEFNGTIALAGKELARQMGLGRRDSWMLADAILVRFLCDEVAEDILTDLESQQLETTFYESTYEAVGALLEEGLGRGTPLEERLRNFWKLLERRGGLAARG